jgi:hypothetical protein
MGDPVLKIGSLFFALEEVDAIDAGGRRMR